MIISGNLKLRKRELMIKEYTINMMMLNTLHIVIVGCYSC